MLNDGDDATMTTQRQMNCNMVYVAMGEATWAMLQWVTTTLCMLQQVIKGPLGCNVMQGGADCYLVHVAMVTAT